MGGLLHLFDFHNNSFSRKVFSHHKSRDEDLEAPRNSFELQVDNFQTYHNEKDKPQSNGFEEDEWYERSCYPIEESMKKKIIEELSKRSNDKHNSPSLVAKLMGMDALPLESNKPTAWINPRQTTKVDQSHERGKRNKKERRLASAVNVMETEEINPPVRREHPQEEELQRFRREFEAWQADKRSKDCSRIAESGCVARDEKERLFTRTRSFGRDFNLKSDRTGPTRIVVLRPGLQRVYDYEDSLTTSSGTTMEGSRGSSIEEFLEEVKESLKGELQGRALKRSSSVRGSGIETPFSERPFPRSESMRSYAASEVQCNAPDSPQEFISRDTRRLLAERLRNVLRKEMSPSDVSAAKCSSSSRLRPTVSDAESLRKQTDEIDEEDSTAKRNVPKKDSSSPRNLKRSLSAPVSGTSFGKLLLEDRHVLTGAQIMRKHEAVITEREETEAETEPVFVDPIRRKERFNLRKKVSSFRSTLRGRIFGKKIRSMIESNSFEDESIKDFVTGSRFNNFYDRNENSTEVPPSPASVCSSTPEEFWRNVDYLSQSSTPDVTVSDENGMPQVFRDISSNLSELRRQINELESDVQVPTPVEEEVAREIETTVDLGNSDKVFVRDLLVASGLYEGTTDRSLSRWDPFAKPINKSVLEETKENLKKRSNQSREDEDMEENMRSEDNHNILFDLLNEVLTVVLGPLTKSGFRKKFMSSCVSESTAIRGKYLLESAWRIMSEYLYSQPDKPFCSLDGIIGWDLERCPWSGLIGEEVTVLGREVEGMIMADLVEEVVKDLRAQMV